MQSYSSLCEIIQGTKRSSQNSDYLAYTLKGSEECIISFQSHIKALKVNLPNNNLLSNFQLLCAAVIFAFFLLLIVPISTHNNYVF